MTLPYFDSSLEAFLKARIEEELHRPEAPEFRGSITISRESGCRARAVCDNLASYLSGADAAEGSQWMVHDKEIVDYIIEANHLSEYLAPLLSEKKPDPVEGYLAEMLKTRPSDWTLFQKTADAIRKLARMGGAIIIGRGGNFITADMGSCFQVRLIGSERERLKVVRESRNLDDKGAAEYLRRADRDRLGYVRSHLHKDSTDPLAYHAVINTDDASDKQLARMIGEMYFAWYDDRASVIKPQAAN